MISTCIYIKTGIFNINTVEILNSLSYRYIDKSNRLYELFFEKIPLEDVVVQRIFFIAMKKVFGISKHTA